MSRMLNVDVQPVDQPETAFKGADIALCATSSEDAVFFKQWLEPGMHVGSIRNPEIEMDAIRLMNRIVIHTRGTKPITEVSIEIRHNESVSERKSAKPGDVDIKQFPTIAEVIAGKAPGRQGDKEITCFLNNLGLGYQFAAAGAVVLKKAKGSGLGHELPTDWFTEDVRP